MVRKLFFSFLLIFFVAGCQTANKSFSRTATLKDYRFVSLINVDASPVIFGSTELKVFEAFSRSTLIPLGSRELANLTNKQKSTLLLASVVGSVHQKNSLFVTVEITLHFTDYNTGRPVAFFKTTGTAFTYRVAVLRASNRIDQQILRLFTGTPDRRL